MIKLISEKVSYKKEGDSIQVIILGKIERWKEAVLTAWLLAWIFCGGVVFNEYLHATVREQKMVFVVFLVFWAYYFWRIGKVWMFRRGGNELIRIDKNELTLKRSYFTFGRSKTFQLDQLSDLKRISIPKKSFAYSFENAWWVLGGERVGFTYHSKFIKFGMQLNEKEASEFYGLISKKIKSNQR